MCDVLTQYNPKRNLVKRVNIEFTGVNKMSKTRVTMQDIARSLGVDHSTVSLALRSDPRIPEQTRDRVHRAAQKLNYMPNHLARTLSGGRSRVVGVMMPDMRNQFFVPHVEEIQAMAERQDLAVSIKFSNWDLDREDRGLLQFCTGRVDGIIWAPIIRTEDAMVDMLKKIDSAAAKLVVIGGVHMGLPMNRVRCSSLRATRVAVDYLVKLGHRRVGLAGATRMAGNRGDHHRIRVQDMRDALAEVGLGVRDQDVFTTADDLCGGVEIAGQIAKLDPKDRPTVVFAADDMLAREMIAGFTVIGVDVPNDISVLGYDDAPGDATAPIALTSVSLRGRDVGRHAGQLLADLIEGAVTEKEPQFIALEPEIVERASCIPWRDKTQH